MARPFALAALSLLVAAAALAGDRRPPVAMPAEWSRCRADAECTFVSLGCCDTTPVNRRHADDARGALRASKREECPPKTACGPGADGTWQGTPGRCLAGVCGCDPRGPMAAACEATRSR